MAALVMPGADLKAQAAAAEDQGFLPDVGFPLPIFDDVAHHTKDNCSQRGFAQRTDNTAGQRQREAAWVQDQGCMRGNGEDTAPERQVALGKPLEQQWAQHGAYNKRASFRQV